MKKMKRKKGFTLIELLAVIVVLGIILVIAIPNIINLINDTKVAAYDRQKDLIIDATRKYVVQNEQNITWTDNTATIYLSDLQNAHLLNNPLRDPRGGVFSNNATIGTKVVVTRDGNNYTYTIVAVSIIDTTPPVITLLGSSSIDVVRGNAYTDAGATAADNTDGDITGQIVANNPVDTAKLGTYTVTYNVKDAAENSATQVTRTVNVIPKDYVTNEGVNKPTLIVGMTPIKWGGSAWVNTTEADADWYNYTTSDKRWANAKTADDSIWVWIPRYAYRITSNYNTSTTGDIDIKFLKDNSNIAGDNSIISTTSTYTGNVQDNFIIHPAFTFGGTELTGIWVAKFEVSVANTADACYTNPTTANCNKSTLIPKIVQGYQSWQYVSIDSAFTASRNMETNNTYGWGTSGTGFDTHLLKNIEWGAAAYLAQSTYGKNSEVWMNNNSYGVTGCAGSEVVAAENVGCQYAYNTPNGMNGSTTGNTYGIYDMSGGSAEFVAAYINNSNAALDYGSSLVDANDKYKDIYTVTTDDVANNYSNASVKKGDAVYETSASYNSSGSWNTDYSYMPYTATPWFVRGGAYNNGAGSGTFNFYFTTGWTTGHVSFRVAIVPSD